MGGLLWWRATEYPAGRRCSRSAKRTSQRALPGAVRPSSRRDAALVQSGGDKRPGGPGGLERAQIVVVAHAPARVDLESRKGRRELGHRAQRRPGAAANAGEI